MRVEVVNHLPHISFRDLHQLRDRPDRLMLGRGHHHHRPPHPHRHLATPGDLGQLATLPPESPLCRTHPACEPPASPPPAASPVKASGSTRHPGDYRINLPGQGTSPPAATLACSLQASGFGHESPNSCQPLGDSARSEAASAGLWKIHWPYSSWSAKRTILPMIVHVLRPFWDSWQPLADGSGCPCNDRTVAGRPIALVWLRTTASSSRRFSLRPSLRRWRSFPG
ncbi:hypothetical protein FB390_3734 [Nocardia bhagyanarayanae]|uniref:Uncharacterized protein n=1 Tax=Nocardia bhagyanarayanae TaxID=1215925 RepID=A0A543FE74_9NOCA|nr:hypothetical protein FB390_3734 [Nocardia bhagyanarayanae]